MRTISLMVISIMMVGLVSCTGQPKKGDDKKAQLFGEEFKPKGAISYDDLLGKIATVDSMEVIVTGKVASVCQVKGCWMNIVSDTNEESMFVKFHDYGFFMPKDISGRTVTMKGVAFREVTTVDELRHYAEDEGKSEEEIALITEPTEELKFMATGVILAPVGK